MVLCGLHKLVLGKVQIHIVSKYGNENLGHTKCEKAPCLLELASERDDYVPIYCSYIFNRLNENMYYLGIKECEVWG